MNVEKQVQKRKELTPQPPSVTGVYLSGPLKNGTFLDLHPLQQPFAQQHVNQKKKNYIRIDHAKAQIRRRVAASGVVTPGISSSTAASPGQSGQRQDRSQAVPSPDTMQLEPPELSTDI